MHILDNIISNSATNHPQIEDIIHATITITDEYFTTLVAGESNPNVFAYIVNHKYDLHYNILFSAHLSISRLILSDVISTTAIGSYRLICAYFMKEKCL